MNSVIANRNWTTPVAATVHVLVIAVTVFLFLLCRPTGAHATYWLAMGDVLAVQLLITVRNLDVLCRCNTRTQR